MDIIDKKIQLPEGPEVTVVKETLDHEGVYISLDPGEKVEVISQQSSVTVANVCDKLGIQEARHLHTIERKTVLDYLNLLHAGAGFINMYKHWEERFLDWPAGAKKHHTDVGGLERHTAEVIALAIDMKWLRKNMFSEVSDDDIIIAGFLHDFSKVKMYRRSTDEEQAKDGYPFRFDNQLQPLDPETWTLQQCMEFGVKLTPDQISGLYWAEGGWGPWAQRRSRPPWTKLGVLISNADVYSAMVMGQ